MATARADDARDDDDDDLTGLIGARSKTAPLVGGGIAILLLWLAGLGSCTGSIQNDLTDEARAALDRAGYRNVDVSFSGRDATLTGSTGDLDSAAAHRLVRDITGVRHVDEDFDAGGTAAAPATTVPTTTVPATTDAPKTTAAPTPSTTIVEPTTTTVAQADVQQDINALLAGRVIEFATGSASLTPAGNAVVDEVAPLLNQAPSAKVQIQGHTDNTGNAAANQALSLARAETVRQALVARGIAADRLTTIGFGGDRPVDDNATSAGRQRNRRIDFLLS